MAARDQHPPSTTSPLPVRRRRALVTALAIATAVAAPTAFAAAAGTGIEAVASVSTTGSSADDRFEAQGAADAVLFRPETTTSTSTSAPPATAPTIAPTAPPPPPPPPPPPAPPAPPTTQASSYGDPADPATWDRLSQCEAGGNWAANTGNGYYGGLQFSLSSWQAVGGTGYPHQHSRETQIEMGRRLYASQGWDAWPACSRELGYR